jgi:primase-polymerase (primpol)-like protein
MIKETTGILAENIPEELTELEQWVCWRYEERDNKLTKIPCTPQGGRASTTDSLTWAAFDVALKASRDHDGIGFVFTSGDPFAGIDVDKCRDPETGDVAPSAQKILDRVQDGYLEISPSGRGIHVIIRGDVRGGGIRRGPVEMYSRGRYFTITGRVL